MSAAILPYPRARNQRFIRRHAGHMATASTIAKGEAHLQRQLLIQRETLERRGVDAERIMAELTTLERNIRAAAWSLMSARGGAA